MCPCLIPLEIYTITKSNFKHIFVVLGLFFAFEEKFCLCFLAFFLWGDFLILMRVIVLVSKTPQSGDADYGFKKIYYTKWASMAYLAKKISFNGKEWVG